MGIFKKEKERKEFTDSNDLKDISDLLGEFDAREIEMFMIMGRAAEKSPDGPYRNAMSMYLERTKVKLNEIEDRILDEGHKLITRHLLDDVDEDEYIEMMEEVKIKLKILRDVQQYTEFLANKQISGNKNMIVINSNSNRN